MPPPSPAKFSVEAVGIPTCTPARKIKNLNEKSYEKGYDSDGEIGPFFDAVENESRVGVEEEDHGFIPDSMVTGQVTEGSPDEPVIGVGQNENLETRVEPVKPDWLLSKEEIDALKVDDLKTEIKKRALVPKGKKPQLRQMLYDCMEQGLPIRSDIEKKDRQVLSGFPVGSNWRQLVPSADIVPDPENIFAMYAPTDNPEHLPIVPK